MWIIMILILNLIPSHLKYRNEKESIRLKYALSNSIKLLDFILFFQFALFHSIEQKPLRFSKGFLMLHYSSFVPKPGE